RCSTSCEPSAPARRKRSRASSSSNARRRSSRVGNQTKETGTAGMSENLTRAEELGRAAIAKVRAGEIETALEMYDAAIERTDDEANEPLWKVLALNELGSISDMDSKFTRAIECGEEAMALLEHLGNREEHEFVYALTLENLGASKLLNDEFEDGIRMIEKALPSIASPLYLAEAYIDLCFGYLSLNNL